jgi:hypothetical protein
MSFHVTQSKCAMFWDFLTRNQIRNAQEVGSSSLIFHFAQPINSILHCFRFMEVHVTIHMKLERVH